MYEHESAFHRIKVIDREMLRILQFERNRQSSMYLDAPFDTDFEYPSYFHLSMAVKPDAGRTLVIGLGGGTVVKRMWRDYPEMRIDAVEIDPEVVDVAREFFALPDDPRIRVVVGEGRDYLERAPREEVYDILIVDAFDDDRVPRLLRTEEFMRLAREHLAPDGVAVYNFIGSHSGSGSRGFRSMHRTLASVWRRVWVFLVNEGVVAPVSNLILLATDSDLSTDTLLERVRDRVGGAVTVPAFDTFADDLYRGPVRTGDVPLIVDEPKARRRS